MAKGYLRDQNNDLIIENGDFKTGDTPQQEIYSVLQLSQGELKSDPLLGPNFTVLLRGKVSDETFKRLAKLHLERDGKDFEAIKDELKLVSNGG